MKKLYLLTIAMVIGVGSSFAQQANTVFQTPSTPLSVAESGNEVFVTFTTVLQQYILEYILCRTVNGTTVEIATSPGFEYDASVNVYVMTDPNPVLGQAAVYTLKHRDRMNNATTEIATINFMPVTINEPNAGLDISIYPNPMVDFINLEQPLSPTPLDVTIVNAIGQVVMVYSQTATKRSISVSDLREGVYLMQLSRDDKIMRTIRLLKTN
ncbi:MAG: T9SS type A sorting domain-containing protein [Flavobacteriales bacterium]|nr:T9SS type A sorting domain-containing protein [Flavobacteriales bacterium]